MPTPRAPFRPDLAALRGVAILLVVGFHAGVPALAGAFVAVDVLFVLSGFLMTRQLAREWAAEGTIDLPAFWTRRALRLVPPLLVVLAATLAATWLVLAPIDRAAVAESARAAALGVANQAYARGHVDYFAQDDSPLLHTWSLAVEQQVSLVWPALFLALAWLGARGGPRGAAVESRRRADGLARGVALGLAALGAASLATAVVTTWASPSWAYFGTAARAWAFAVGGLVALVVPSDVPNGEHGAAPRSGPWWIQGAGLVALAAGVAAYDARTPYPGLAALLPVAGTAAILVGGAVDAGAGPLGSRGALAAALRWLGARSYAWYLWHWPAVVLGGALLPGLGVAGALAWSAAALVPAWAMHRWVERPARAAADAVAVTADVTADGEVRVGVARPARTWWLAGTAAGTLALVLATVALARAAARDAASPAQRALAAARADRLPHACWDAHVDGARGRTASRGDIARSPAGCVFGDPRGRVTVALMGDSHAEHWLAALDRLGRERGWRVVPFVRGGCPAADAPGLVRARALRRDDACAEYREAAVRRIVALRPAVAVLSSYDGYVMRGDATDGDRGARGRVPADEWRRGLARTYARLAGAGVPVVALRGTPLPGFDVPACLSRRVDGRPLAAACTYDRGASLHHAARAAEAAAVRDAASRGLPVRGIDMADVVCAASPCLTVRDGRVVYTDDNHLTARFTRAVAPALGARLDAALATAGVRLP